MFLYPCWVLTTDLQLYSESIELQTELPARAEPQLENNPGSLPHLSVGRNQSHFKPDLLKNFYGYQITLCLKFTMLKYNMSQQRVYLLTSSARTSTHPHPGPLEVPGFCQC